MLNVPDHSVLLLGENQVIAANFWDNLKDAVNDVRELVDLNNCDPDDGFVAKLEHDRSSTNSRTLASSVPIGVPVDGTSVLLFNNVHLPHQQTIRQVLKQDLSSELQEHLLLTYHTRFDSVFKVLHWPAAIAMIKRPDPMNPGHARASCTLKTAIQFAAVCTLAAHELEDRRSILQQTWQNVEVSLSDASLLTTTSIVVLQAFVIYLVYARRCNQSVATLSITRADGDTGSITNLSS